MKRQESLTLRGVVLTIVSGTGLLFLATGCDSGNSAPKPEPAPSVPAKKTTPPPPAEPASKPEADAALGATVLTGTVKVVDPPRRKKIRMNADPKCAAVHSEPVYSDAIVADDKGRVRWAFVYVKAGTKGGHPVPKDSVLINQTGCRYVPHVFGVRAGQEILIRNSDDLLHNIHALPFSNAEFNFGQPRKGLEERKTFDKPEVMVKIKCDVHPWMSAWVGVMEHPYYAVTDEAGRYEIKGLPPGKYSVEAWHELYQSVTQEIEVGKDGSPALNFTMSKRRE